MAMSKRNSMINRVTFDDLLSSGSSDDFKVIQDSISSGPRVIKKKKMELLPEMYRNEAELKKAATDLFGKLPRCKLLKTDNMALMVGNGRKVKTRNPGMADHHLCLNGFFVAIEAKMPGKDLDPDQIDYKNEVLAAGGIFIIYHSVSELISEMKKYRLVNKHM